MECKYCKGNCIKKRCPNDKQNYQCKVCKKYQRKEYIYRMCTLEDEQMLIEYNNEGVSISSMARLTGISKANVVNKIPELGKQVNGIVPKEEQQKYEIDEMSVLIGKKDNAFPLYLIYALNKTSKQVVDWTVGRRTKECIGRVVETIKSLNPKKIYTDKLNIYAALLENKVHVATSYMINHIERFNLTLRTHLRRLSRNTICFSKSKEMLECSLKLYLCRKQLLGV
jgi:insertion element IS1 protein InsB